MLIKVQSADITLGFDTSPSDGIIDVQIPNSKHPDETWVFISPVSKYFRIMHPRYGMPQGEHLTNGFLVIPINKNSYSESAPGMVYRCVVSVEKTKADKEGEAPVVIVTTNPNKSRISVDNRDVYITPRVLDLKPGMHELSFNAKDYRTLKVNVDASTFTSDTTLHYELIRQHGTLHLQAEDRNPVFSVIGFHDAVFELANHQSHSSDIDVYPSKYLLFATAWHHRMQIRMVKVNDGDSLFFDFNMKHLPLHIFAIPTVSKPSGLDDMAYGAMVGFVRRRGLYFSMQSTKDLGANGEAVSFDDMRYLAENPYVNSSHCYYRAISGGMLLRLWSPVHFYAGMGIGERQFTWDGRDGKRHIVERYDHKKGCLKECGVIVNIWKIALMGGVMKYDGVKNAQLGVGVYW